MNPSSWALTLPKVPAGVWGFLLSLFADRILAPGLRLLAERVDDWADGDEVDEAPTPHERAVVRLKPTRLRRSR